MGFFGVKLCNLLSEKFRLKNKVLMKINPVASLATLSSLLFAKLRTNELLPRFLSVATLKTSAYEILHQTVG